MTELQGNTNNTLKTLEERMNTTDVEINDVKEEQRSDKAEAGKMTLIQESIAEQLAELETRTNDSWKSLEDGVAGRHQELQDLAVKVEGHFVPFLIFLLLTILTILPSRLKGMEDA